MKNQERPLGELDQRVTEMWAWICFDGNGEGLPAFMANIEGQQTSMPMCGADRARVESMRHIAEDVADRTGAKVELRRFTGMTTVATIEPKASK